MDDEHCFLLPQGKFPNVTPRIRYGPVPELICTFPDESNLRSALWELHEVEQGLKRMEPSDFLLLKERYELVFGAKREFMPPECIQSPAHLPIPDSVRHLLGKSYIFRGLGHDFNVDRIYIREKIKQLISGFGYYCSTFLIRMPCTILEGNFEIIVADTDSMDRINKGRVINAVATANLLFVCTSGDALSGSTKDLLVQSGFLKKLLSNGVDNKAIFIDLQPNEGKSKLKRTSFNTTSAEYTIQQQRRLHLTKEFKQLLLKESSPIFLLDKERIEQIISTLVILPVKPLLYLSLYSNPNIAISKLDGQPVSKVKSFTNVPALLSTVQNQVLSMCAEKIRDQNKKWTTTTTVSPIPIPSSTTSSSVSAPKQINLLENEKLDRLATSFKEKLSSWKTTCHRVAADIASQSPDLSSTVKKTVLDVPQRMNEMMNMSNSLLLECTRMVETSPDASPIDKERMKRFVGAYQLINDRSIRGKLMQLKREIDHDASECASALKSGISDGHGMDPMVGIQPIITEEIQGKLSTLLNKCIQQLELLETDLQNSVTCVYKMRQILTPGKEKCFDPSSVDASSAMSFMPADQVQMDVDNRNNPSKNREFRVQRLEPITVEAPDFVLFDERNAPRLFSNDVWNFKFGSQGAPFRNRFQEQLKKVGLRLVDIKYDGNNQFRAFAEQVYGSEDLHSLVRFLVVKDILANPTNYESLLNIRANMREYVCLMAKDAVHGDHLTLSAMANVYGADMLIFAPIFPRPILIRSKTRTTDRVYCLAYVNRNNFQSLRSTTVPQTKVNISSNLSFVQDAPNAMFDRVQGDLLSGGLRSQTKSEKRPLEESSPSIDNSMDIEMSSAVASFSFNSPVSSTSTTPSTTPTTPSSTPKLRHELMSPDQGKNKIRRLNTRRATVVRSLTELCIAKVAEHVEFMPSLSESLPEDLIQQLLTHLNKQGTIDDKVLENTLDSSFTSLELAQCKQITDASCAIIANKCAYLKRLSLSGCINISNTGLEHIARHCSQLEEIDLEGCCNIEDAGVQAIAKRCHQLKIINLSGCIKLTNATLKDLSCLCPDIASISLKKCHQITDPAFHLIGDKLSQLDLSECPQISDSAIIEIANKSCGQLQVLKLAGKNITDESMQALASKCRNLKELELVCCESITDATVQFLSQSCHLLTSLSLSNCKNISNAAFVNNGLANLCHLDLTRCIKLTDEGIKCIVKGSKGLLSLNLTSCEGVTDAGLEYIADSCDYINSITLTKCPKVTDIGIMVLSNKCRCLSYLDLQRCSITDEGVNAIAVNCTEMKELNLSSLDKLTDDCIQHLYKLTQLETLILEDLRLTELGVSSIASCSQLTTLKLSYSAGVTDQSLQKLSAQLPQLRVVDLSYCNAMTPAGLLKAIASWSKLKVLILRGFNHITTEAIEHPNLETLTLSWCKHLEDKAVLSLSECPKLTTLDLAWCAKISGNSLHKLAQQCPSLKSLNLRGCNKISFLTLKFLKASGRMVYR
eukprot:TRINITY_DN2206_c0_g2_i4.p1 TRINITY_DN2206_c0_g2~~TRINITY_DN2206_c0_g2_i4.p1  ORF type:complete len:1488 (+),score=274.93 TRINITY_DN2206_c0_g2_i4:992-5455(+)